MAQTVERLTEYGITYPNGEPKWFGVNGPDFSTEADRKTQQDLFDSQVRALGLDPLTVPRLAFHQRTVSTTYGPVEDL